MPSENLNFGVLWTMINHSKFSRPSLSRWKSNLIFCTIYHRRDLKVHLWQFKHLVIKLKLLHFFLIVVLSFLINSLRSRGRSCPLTALLFVLNGHKRHNKIEKQLSEKLIVFVLSYTFIYFAVICSTHIMWQNVKRSN